MPGGHNGIETRMDVLFSEGVAKNRLTVEQFVKLTAEAPARLFGLYPRKGVIAVGSDADLVLIDPAARHTIRLDELHSACDYSLWDGWELDGPRDGDRAARAGAGGGRQLGRPAAHRRLRPRRVRSASPAEPGGRGRRP